MIADHPRKVLPIGGRKNLTMKVISFFPPMVWDVFSRTMPEVLPSNVIALIKLLFPRCLINQIEIPR